MRYLKPVQILGRLYFYVYRPKPSLDEFPVRRMGGSGALAFPAHSQRIFSPVEFRFLNRSRELEFPAGWNDPAMEKLWLYNLHYFEDLVSEGAEARAAWHRDLVERWIAENPPCSGNGWEPYPLSLRIGNWIKWALAGNEMETRWLNSLALQAEYLFHRIEWRLLGNHLFENARALVIAGTFFEGRCADRWRQKGLRILDKQLEEQVLGDGAHFERSPMYQGLVLEGLMDLIQVSDFYSMNGEYTGRWRTVASEMLAWLRGMLHPDGGISFFNDAAFDISLSCAGLAGYARRLDVEAVEPEESSGIAYMEDSGYIRMVRGNWFALLDVAPLGPDHLPGHGHADTLAFELSVHGQRLLVNSGTGEYGIGEERLRQRGTAAHNTVEVDGENSSEVWGGFRVARRAKPFDVSVRGGGDTWKVMASHDGYRRLPGRVIHRRAWLLSESRLEVRDELEGTFGRAIAYFHFHPEVVVEFDGRDGVIGLGDGNEVRLSVLEGEAEWAGSSYHPGFGVSVENRCLRVLLVGGVSEVVFEMFL